MEDSTIIARDWWFCFRWFNCWKDFFERETRIQFQKGMFPSRMNSLTLWSFMSNQEFFSSPFLGTSLDNCSLLGFVFRLFKMDSGYLSTWLVGGTCGGILRRWRKMRHWKAYRIWPWPFPIYLFFLVNNNLCIIGAKKIVISLSLAVEDGTWEGMDWEVCHLCFVPAKAWINEIRFIIIFAPHLNYHKLAGACQIWRQIIKVQ
jgi:hypothetical protein